MPQAALGQVWDVRLCHRTEAALCFVELEGWPWVVSAPQHAQHLKASCIKAFAEAHHKDEEGLHGFAKFPESIMHFLAWQLKTVKQ